MFPTETWVKDLLPEHGYGEEYAPPFPSDD